jgi:hypothetical protein
LSGYSILTTALDFVGPDGEHITLSQLPPKGLKRWNVRQKLLVVAAARYGMLTLAEACEHYDLNLEEYLTWQRSFDEVWPSEEPKIERYRG